MFRLAFAMIPEFFPAREVGRAQGIISAMFAGGAVIGLVLGGWLASDYGWQDTYHTVIAFAILLPILAYYILRESPIKTGEAVAVPGFTALGIGLMTDMLGITESTYWGWTSFTSGSIASVPWGVPEFMIIAAVLFGFFAYWEGRARSPVLRLRSLRVGNILVSNINGVISGLTMFVTFTTMTILIELPFTPGLSATGFGQNEFWMGIVSVPAAASMLVLGMPLGRMTSHLGPKPVMLLGFGMGLVGALLLTQYSNPAFSLAYWSTWSPGSPPFNLPQAIPYSMVLGSALMLVGTVASLIAMSNVIVLTVSPQELGVQTGMNQTFRNLGSAIGPVLVSSVISGGILSYYAYPPPIGTQPIYAVAAFQYCFIALAVISAIGVLCTLFLRNYRYRADGTKLTDVSLVGKYPPPVAPPVDTDPAPSLSEPARR